MKTKKIIKSLCMKLSLIGCIDCNEINTDADLLIKRKILNHSLFFHIWNEKEGWDVSLVNTF